MKVDGVIKTEINENELHVTLKKGEQYFANMLEVFVGNQIHPQFITTEKVNLETVFLKLTGKKLRD